MERSADANIIEQGTIDTLMSLQKGNTSRALEGFRSFAKHFTLDPEQLKRLQEHIPSTQRFNLCERALYDMYRAETKFDNFNTGHLENIKNFFGDEVREQIHVGFLIGMLEKPKTFELYRGIAARLGITLTPENIKDTHQEFIKLLYQTQAASDEEDERSVKAEVEELAKKVKARFIHGKFPEEFTFGEKTYHFNNKHEYTTFGDEELAFENSRVRHVMEPIFSFERILERTHLNPPEFDKLRKKHLFGFTVFQGQDVWLSYFYPVQLRDGFGRQVAPVVINLLIDRETTGKKFLELVRKNPDSAEFFIQSATGIGDTIPRVKSDEIVLINFNALRKDNANSDSEMINAILDNKNGEIERYKYSESFGTKDPTAIP